MRGPNVGTGTCQASTVALPTGYVERAHAVLAHVAEGHRLNWSFDRAIMLCPAVIDNAYEGFRVPMTASMVANSTL
jgi:hypothetical protein